MTEASTRPVLVVDDREENRYILTRILRRSGFETHEAVDGRHALFAALENPELVILDVNLPDMTGYEVCRRLKANPATSSIPVIHISAKFTSTESRVQSLEGGADAYLTQPVEPAVLLATVRALLRLRKAETISRLSARQWQSTFDALGEGIALLDNDDRFIRCNRAMSELLGKPYREIEGQPMSSVLGPILGRAAGDFLNVDERVTREIAADTQWLRITVDPMRGESDGPGGRILVLTDVTDRKLKDEALRASERLAATGRLAHAIAHEINNPLEALTNLVYLAQTANNGGVAGKYLQMAQTELDRISRITKQTLAFNRETVHPVEFDAKEAVFGVLALHKREIDAKRVHIEVCGQGCQLHSFPGEFQQIISNVVRNAIDAVSSGGRIRIRCRRSVDWHGVEQSGARILISDNGPGIPEEVRKRIFDAFFTTKELKGSGLGLWLSNSVANKRGGHLSFRTSTSEHGHGTCFALFLPDQYK